MLQPMKLRLKANGELEVLAGTYLENTAAGTWSTPGPTSIAVEFRMTMEKGHSYAVNATFILLRCTETLFCTTRGYRMALIPWKDLTSEPAMDNYRIFCDMHTEMAHGWQ